MLGVRRCAEWEIEESDKQDQTGRNLPEPLCPAGIGMEMRSCKNPEDQAQEMHAKNDQAREGELCYSLQNSPSLAEAETRRLKQMNFAFDEQ